MAYYNDYYGAPYCGGLQAVSGKGAAGGPNLGAGQRYQKVLVWPSWRKSGTDVYCSSRWDSWWHIYDLYWTPKNVSCWWESKSWDWVWVQEIPWRHDWQEFVWSKSVNPTAKSLKKQRWQQLQRHLRGKTTKKDRQ